MPVESARPIVTLTTEPADGTVKEIAEGLLWLRLPLPYEPGHVNVYLIEAREGWTVVDAGLFDVATCSIWDRLLDELPHGRPIAQVIATHWHPDHLGAAGWLCERTGAVLISTESEYLTAQMVRLLPRAEGDSLERSFYLKHGLPADETELWVANGRKFMQSTFRVPPTYRRLAEGDRLRVGVREFDVLTTAGHSPEQLILFDRKGNLMLCADHVSTRMPTTMAVQQHDPQGDPLGRFLAGLAKLESVADDGTLVLPGHGVPFRGLSTRGAELRAHYAARCALVAAACKERALSANELLGVLYRRRPGPVWIGFIIGEMLAFANHLVSTGELEAVEDNGIVRFAAPAPA